MVYKAMQFSNHFENYVKSVTFSNVKSNFLISVCKKFT